MSTISKQLTKLKILVGSLEEQTDEYKRLKNLGQTANHQQILLTLSTCYNLIKKVEIDLIDELDFDSSNLFQKLYGTFKTLIGEYTKVFKSLGDEGIDIQAYEYSDTSLREAIELSNELSNSSFSNSQVKRNKSVRFKDGLIEGATQSTNNPLKPYRDDPTESEETQVNKEQLFAVSNANTSERGGYKDDEGDNDPGKLGNSQLFIANQQELLNQDDLINNLSRSVQQQRQLGLSINEEIDNHMVLLDDLEQGIERQDRKITRARSNLRDFRERMKKNGDWCAIFFLIVVLLLLLIVLK